MIANIKKILTQLMIILISGLLGTTIHFLFIKNALKEFFNYLFKDPNILLYLALGVEIIIFYIMISSFLKTKIPRLIYLFSTVIYSGFLGMLLFNRSDIYYNRINLDMRYLIINNASADEILSTFTMVLFMINIILFIPIGYFLKRKRFIFFFITAILITFGIEFIQLIFEVGVFDINDIILNLSGMLLGYSIGRLKK